MSSRSQDIIKVFPSASAFLEWATRAPSPWRGRLKSRLISDDRTSWTGTETYKEAHKLARYGWRQGVEKLRSSVPVGASTASYAVARLRYDVAGSFPDAARAATGDMFSMGTPYNPDREERPVVRMRYDMGVTFCVDPNIIISFGGALLTYVERLELARFPVGIDMCWDLCPSVGSRDSAQVSFQFPLKRVGERLSMSGLAFWVAHPSALRRIGFSALERLDIEKYYGEGYGKPRPFTDTEPGVVRLCAEEAISDSECNLKTIRAAHLAVVPSEASYRRFLPSASCG
jgi:hypothetical protein